MRGVNKVILIGNLGKDPDFQHVEGNVGVAKFPLATTETFKDRNGAVVTQTEWHAIVLWRGLADLAHKYLRKGSLVYLEGRLKTRNWEDKDKNKRYNTEIVVENLVMLDKRKDLGDFFNGDGLAAANSIKGIADVNFENNNDPGIEDDELTF